MDLTFPETDKTRKSRFKMRMNEEYGSGYVELRIPIKHLSRDADKHI